MLPRCHDDDDDDDDHHPHLHIVSYNVLASAYAPPDRFPHTPSDVWGPSRRAAIAEQIQRWVAHQVDVLCLQEVEKEHFAELVQMLSSDGFTGVLQQRPRCEKKPPAVMNATFYRHDRWEMHWAVHRSRSLVLGLESRGLGRLSPATATSSVWAVANVHLIAQGTDDMREQQLTSTLRYLRAHAPDAVVVCGDFNARPGSSLDSVLTRESMCNAYSTRRDDDVLDATWIEPGCFATLDHLWHSSYFMATHVLNLLARDDRHHHAATLRSHVQEGGGLPCHGAPSDHLPIGAILRPRQSRAGGLDDDKHGAATVLRCPCTCS